MNHVSCDLHANFRLRSESAFHYLPKKEPGVIFLLFIRSSCYWLRTGPFFLVYQYKTLAESCGKGEVGEKDIWSKKKEWEGTHS